MHDGAVTYQTTTHVCFVYITAHQISLSHFPSLSFFSNEDSLIIPACPMSLHNLLCSRLFYIGYAQVLHPLQFHHHRGRFPDRPLTRLYQCLFSGPGCITDCSLSFPQHPMPTASPCTRAIWINDPGNSPWELHHMKTCVYKLRILSDARRL